MKQTIHKLLCMLLVLTMLCSLAPAVFADEPGDAVEHTAEHTLEYIPITDQEKHVVVCTFEGCTMTPYMESCSGDFENIGNGQHQHRCSACDALYGTPEDCVDTDKNGLCDACGENMPAAETKQIGYLEKVPGIEVTLGTQLQAALAQLPKSVRGYSIADRRYVDCTVTWSCDTYDKDKPGIYTATGTVTAPEGYALIDGLGTIQTTIEVLGDYSIKLSIDGASVTVGQSVSVLASIKKDGKNITSLPGGVSLSWKVDDEELASVSGYGGSSYNCFSALLTGVSTGKTASDKTVTVTATLKDGTTTLATGSAAIKITPATASIIKVNAASGGVSFGESAFYSALSSSKLSSELYYVKFSTLPSSREGKLYSDNTYYGRQLTSSDICYYNPRYSSNVIDLDDVYFKAEDTYTGSYVTMGYTAYNSAGNVIATGSIEVQLSLATIKYSVEADGKVTFDEDDFRSVLRASYSGATLDYVQFDMSNAVFGNAYGGSGKYGYLYIDSSLQTKLTASNDSAKFAYNYKSSSSRYYYDLDDVTYVAGSATGKYTVTVPFTAYGTGSYQYVTGVVEIVVDETDAFTIGCTGTDFRSVTKEIANTYKNATYIMFDLPEQGTLYYDFDAINNYGHKVRSNYAYYLEPSAKDEYDLDDVWFVPAAGQTKARISFDVYSGKTKIDSGSITFSIKGRTSSQVFTDVTYANTGSWSADSVDFMYANGLIYGTGKNKFSPNATMTRGDLVLILYRLAGEPSVSGVKNPFKDVTSGDYYYKAVLWAYKNDVVNGTGNGTFSPKKAVTREQLAAILYRYSGSPSTSTRLTGFTDASKVSGYATNAMKWAVGAGIINGNGNKLDPQSSATRAQVAAMLHRYLTK